MANVETKWIASLSDGSTAVEGTPPFDDEYTISAWQKLRRHMDRNHLHITGMRVQATVEGQPTRTYNLPSMKITQAGRHERFHTLSPHIPLNYNYYRWVEGDIYNMEPEKRHIEIRAIYEDFTVSLFVDEIEGTESWVVVHDNHKL